MSKSVMSPTKRTVLRRMCVVGGCSDDGLLDVLRDTYDVEIYRSSDGEEYMDGSDITFYIEDFESDIFTRLFQRSNERETQSAGALRIIGPVVLRNRIRMHKDLWAPRFNRPLYCELMKDVVFALGPEVKEKRKLVDMLHFMGGQVKRDASAKINVYITGQAKGVDFRKVSVLEVILVRPEYVHKCWQNRDDPTFQVLDKELLKQFAVGVFESISVAFLGFDAYRTEQLSKAVLENKGEIAVELANASHVVCNPDNASSWQNICNYANQKYVTDEWIWASVHARKSVSEQPYAVVVPGKQVERTRKSLASPAVGLPSSNSRSSVLDLDHSSHSILNGTPDHMYADDLENLTSPMNKKSEKKRMVAQEMLETEKNYLTALQIMLKFRDVIAVEKNSDGHPLLSPSDAQLIFGRLSPIVAVHRQICDKMQALLDHWKSNCNVAKIWVEVGQELDRAYVPYLNNYETAKAALEKAYANEQFYSFVKTKESSAEFNRNLLKELLIRPVQRLPSVILLLRELQKKSDKSDRQKRRFEEAISMVDHVLSHANQVRANAEKVIALHSKFNEIESMPSILMKHTRQFVHEVDGMILACTDPEKSNVDKKNVRLIFFHDCIAVCKVRNLDDLNGTVHPSPSTGGTLRRFARQASLSTIFRQSTKPYRFLFYIPMQYIRYLREVVQGTEDNNQSIAGDAPLYVLNVRQTISDEIIVFHPKDIEAMKSAAEYVVQQVLIDFARDVSGPPVLVSELELMYPHIADVFYKFMRRTGSILNQTSSMNHSVYHHPSASTMPRPPHRPGGFRKAISSATLSVRNGLHFGGRHTASRSNMMNNISESPCPDTSNNGSPAVSDTPKHRGLRNHLSISIFRRDTLRRRGSNNTSGSDKENNSSRCTDV